MDLHKHADFHFWNKGCFFSTRFKPLKNLIMSKNSRPTIKISLDLNLFLKLEDLIAIRNSVYMRYYIFDLRVKQWLLSARGAVMQMIPSALLTLWYYGIKSRLSINTISFEILLYSAFMFVINIYIHFNMFKYTAVC